VNVFLSAKKWSSTSSMPRRLTGSASGVTMVAKCRTVSLTPGTRALIEALQMGDERGHVRVVEVEARHQVAERLAFRIDAFSDGPGQGRIGIGIAIGTDAVDVRADRDPALWRHGVEEITGGDRRDADLLPSLAPSPLRWWQLTQAATGAFAAQSVAATREHGLARAQPAVQVDSLPLSAVDSSFAGSRACPGNHQEGRGDGDKFESRRTCAPLRHCERGERCCTSYWTFPRLGADMG